MLKSSAIPLILLSLMMSFDTYALTEKQLKIVATKCVQCHATADSTAPLMGNKEDWVEVLKNGEEKMMRNVILGKGGMPPLGYCSACSEEDLLAISRLMAGFDAK